MLTVDEFKEIIERSNSLSSISDYLDRGFVTEEVFADALEQIVTQMRTTFA